jgi:hypothetical protein
VGGGSIAGQVKPGNSERGRGVTLASQYRVLESHLILEGENHVSIPRAGIALEFCNLFWHLKMAVYYGGEIWQIYSAGFWV